jgi:hypothetical protein
MEKVNELVAIKRGGGRVVKIDNMTFYSSDRLNDLVEESFKKSSITKPVASKLRELIDRDLIIPVFSTKNMLHFIYRKVFQPTEYEYTSGFWTPKIRKVFLLIDSNVNVLGYATNTLIAKVLIHELMHVYAHMKPNQYINFFQDELVAFYKTYWGLISGNKEIPDRNIMNILQYMRKSYDNIKGPNTTIGRMEASYKNIIDKEITPFAKRESEIYEKLIKNFFLALRLYFISPMAFRRNYDHPDIRSVISPLLITYRDQLNIGIPKLLCVQELIFPSEVIAVFAASAYPNKVYSAIKQL